MSDITQKVSVRRCFVPTCVNTTANPDKMFFCAPKDPLMRKKWFENVGRSDYSPASKSTYLCCGDHFSLEEDMDNFVRYSIMASTGLKAPKRLKKTAVPQRYGTNRIPSWRSQNQQALESSMLREPQVDIPEQVMMHMLSADSPHKRIALGNITDSPDKMNSTTKLISPKKRSISFTNIKLNTKKAKVDDTVYAHTNTTNQGPFSQKSQDSPRKVYRNFGGIFGEAQCQVVPFCDTSDEFDENNHAMEHTDSCKFRSCETESLHDELYFDNSYQQSEHLLTAEGGSLSLDESADDMTCSSDFVNENSLASELFQDIQTNTMSTDDPYSNVIDIESRALGDDSTIGIQSNSSISVQVCGKSTQTEFDSFSEHQHITSSDELRVDDSHSKRSVGIQVRRALLKPHYRSIKIQCALKPPTLDQSSQCHCSDIVGIVNRACSPIFRVPREPIQPRLSETSSSAAGSTPRSIDDYQPSQSTHSESSIVKNLPIAFRARYSHVYAIIDAFEIQIERPSNPVHQALTWSDYKKCNTLKFLMVCTPDGTVILVSEAFGGRISDCELFEQSGMLGRLPDNCAVMADRGFKNLQALLNGKNCTLLRPPSVLSNSKPTKLEVLETKSIASIRIHVERVIGRLREFRLLTPHSTIDTHLMAHVNSAVQTVAGLINMHKSIIKM
ncbi:hypothetical protein QAD02_013604 [Eretmocerus hayati]|uniref:Uncharacterized protein n=1 Tax=Eretmocerus hayati TaxID=131215 RepID=A0ACC2P5V0_9HYME|nr:hypothetical protein QAD02_013604 [Eretmocerus hayati]